MSQVENLVKILKNHKGSTYEPVKEELLINIEKKYPNMPGNLKLLYRLLGYGCIGDSRYMIHVPTDPNDIYDRETAKELDGILVVGDDFAGNCEAYDANNNWLFGCIADDGVFEAYGNETPSFIHFLTEWFSDNK